MFRSERMIVSALSFFVLVLFVAPHAHAAGHGKGRTQSQFKAYFDAQDKNRLFMKLDVESAIEGLPEVGSSSRNDELGGQELTVTLAGQSVMATFEANGRIDSETFKARLTANGGILQIDLRGLDLVTLLGLDATGSGKDLTATLAVIVSVAAPSSTESTELFNGTLEFEVNQKAEKQAMGKAR